VGSEDTLPADLALLQSFGAQVVVVHGGGPLITHWLGRVGKETHFVNGLRYTDEETVEVVRMVLGGLVNTEVVGRLNAAGLRAVGLTGADDRMILARVRDAELGLVGRVCAVNPRPVKTLLREGYAAVVAPIGLSEDGHFLNINADEVAGELAAALGVARLVFLTDVAGVSDGEARLTVVNAVTAQQLIASGVIAGGMIPKVQAGLRAAEAGGGAQIIDGRQPHALLAALADPEECGTLVVKE
jgi:acetylglutamate kinase